jgi:hypothetical protein
MYLCPPPYRLKIWPVARIKQTTYKLRKCLLILNQRLPGACNRSPGSKLLSITTQLHCGGHLGGRAQLPDTILEEDHPMTIPSKFGLNWATGSRQDGFYVNFPYVKLSTAVQPSWSEGGTTRHKFGSAVSEEKI